MINLGLKRFKQRRVGWALGVVTFAVLALSLVLLFLLTQATQKWELYEQNYELLFTLNAVVAGALLLVIGWAGLKLVNRLRAVTSTLISMSVKLSAVLLPSRRR